MSDIVTLNGYKIKDEKAVRSYETVASMKADTKLKEGYHVKTEGYYEANDGGNGEYIIVDDETLVDDGGSIHVLNNGLRAKLIINDNTINVKQFGAYGDNTHDDTNVFKNVMNFIDGKYLTLFINSGKYILSEKIEANWNTTNYWTSEFDKSYAIKGAGVFNSILKFSSNNGLVINPLGLGNTMSIKVSDFSIYNGNYDCTEDNGSERTPTDSKGIGLLLSHVGYTGNVENIAVSGFYIGIATRYCYCGPTISNCFSTNTVFGYSSKYDTGIIINSSSFRGVEKCYCQEGGKLQLNNCVAESTYKYFYPTEENNARSKFEGIGIYTTGVTTLINTHTESLWGNALHCEGNFNIVSKNSNLNNSMYYQKTQHSDLVTILENLSSHNYDDLYIDASNVNCSADIDGQTLTVDSHGTINCNTSNNIFDKILPNIKINNIQVYQGAQNSINRYYNGTGKPIITVASDKGKPTKNFSITSNEIQIGGLINKIISDPTQFNPYEFHWFQRQANFNMENIDVVGLKIKILKDGKIQLIHTQHNSSDDSTKENIAIQIDTSGVVTFPQNT